MNKGEWIIQCSKHIESTSATSSPRNYNKKYHYHNKDEYECIYCEYNSLKKELESAKDKLEKFCTKSNAVSMHVRCDWKSSKMAKVDIYKLYTYQCEIEEWLNQNNQTKEGE